MQYHSTKIETLFALLCGNSKLPTSNMSFDTLPEEILTSIIIHLSYQQINKFPPNKHFWSIAKNRHFWRQKLIKDFPCVISLNIPKEDDCQLRYWWYDRFELNLKQFNDIIAFCDYDTPDLILPIIDKPIIELGPLVYTQTTLVMKSLMMSDDLGLDLDDRFHFIIEEAIISCFSYEQQNQKV